MQQQIFDLLLKKDDVTWKTLLHDLIQAEGMDPWNINVTQLTQKYINTVKEMQEHDLRISGKILLAAAILLKIKSSHLLENDISRFDALLNQEENDEEFFDELINETNKSQRDLRSYALIPRTPQPRNRKVSINDLIQALQRTMAVKRRIIEKQRPQKFKMPSRKVDIMAAIRDMYTKITFYAQRKEQLTFSQLLPNNPSREDKVYTFLPLLHLENQNKIETTQQTHFSEINIKQRKPFKATTINKNNK